MVTTVCTSCESDADPTCSGCGGGVDVDALLDAARTEQRHDTAQAIAHELAMKVCSDICEHPSCVYYRFAARTARKHATRAPHIPRQGGDPT